MNVEFGSVESVTEIEERVIVGGCEIGRISKMMRGDYHACLRNPSEIAGLLQGFGETRVEAVQNALKKGRECAVNTLEYINSLELELGA